MKKCPKCGSEQPEESKFCSSCGESLVIPEKIEETKEEKVAEEVVEETKIVSTDEEMVVKKDLEENSTEVAEVQELNQEEPEQLEESKEVVINEDVTEATEAEVVEEAQVTAVEASEAAQITVTEATVTEPKVEKTAEETKKANPKKKRILLLSILAAVIVIGIGGFFGYKYIDGRPIDLVADVKVKFKGYETVGTAAFNEEDIQKEIQEVALKKAGVSKKDIEGLVKKEKAVTKKYAKDDELSKKIKEADKLAKQVEVKLSSTKDLSNGKKVTVSVKDKNSDSDKIVKDDSKKVEIKGLKALKEITMDDLLEDVKYSFTGYDGFGELVIEDNPYKDITKRLFSDVTKDGDLSNDDTIELKVNRKVATELLKDGKKLTGKTSTKTEVTGLKNPMEVGKLEECLAKIDELAKKNYEGITFADLEIDDPELKSMNVDMSFKVERQESYLRVQRDILKKGVVFDIQNLYKVGVTMKANGQSVSETFYAVHGYPRIPVEGDDLDFDSTFTFNPIFEETIEAAREELLGKNLDYKKIEKK